MAIPKAAKMPALIYGTAWKKERSRDLVRQALLAGFRGVDTAAQPKHYREDLVGLGITDAIKEGGIKRNEIYIQTKFTSTNGQDPTNLPYNPDSSITEQVNASVASSLKNLGSSRPTASEPAYIDCLLLHSPFPTPKQTQEAWRAMESHVPHSVRTLGISNVYHPPALTALYNFAIVKPVVLQNRFYRETGYDSAIRALCAEKDITYQSFWTLTANPHLLKSKVVHSVAQGAGVSLPVALYGLVLGMGRVSVLDGTTNAERMVEDIGGVQKVQAWQTTEPDMWAEARDAFTAALCTTARVV
ncbi:hypothetical protein LTR36_006688 [Oleoguttula mirabilis]|uniref:NADP-dependent oxidoreductase domain-containing protein n=1 Tax=Oleoguttula mirabilis TaxID=1507867 RepID=A0AAV9JBB7_9PEZI|nr:hypothetical protein LTR36_006688 [Oleoguttula mirabilis]